MATTQITLGYPSNTNIFAETDLEATAKAVKASSATLYYIDIENAANAAPSYVKLWNVASGGVTVGTTAPNMIVMAPGLAHIRVPIPGGIVFDTALTAACTVEPGTAGTTNPASSVIVQLVYA
jgi:hypothetical protein